MKRFYLCALLVLSGCAVPTVQLSTPEGHKVTYRCPKLGNDVKFDQIELEVDGVRATVVGYKSDLSRAFGEGVKAGAALAKP